MRVAEKSLLVTGIDPLVVGPLRARALHRIWGSRPEMLCKAEVKEPTCLSWNPSRLLTGCVTFCRLLNGSGLSFLTYKMEKIQACAS